MDCLTMAGLRILSQGDKDLWMSAMRETKSFAPVDLSPSSFPRLALRERPIETVATVDLHGMTVQDAHAAVIQHLDIWRTRAKFVSFITGQSGAIRREFAHWMQQYAAVRRIEPMNGGGAFKVYFKKVK